MHASARRRKTFYSQYSPDEAAQGIHNNAPDEAAQDIHTKCFHCAETISQKLQSEHRCFETALRQLQTLHHEIEVRSEKCCPLSCALGRWLHDDS
jgi:hypothetical protein